MGEDGSGGGMFTPVVERVVGDVENAHDNGALEVPNPSVAGYFEG
jgi:hypothetical protein